MTGRPLSPAWLSVRRFLLVLVGLLMLGLVVAVAAADNLGQDIRWFNDYYDRGVYARIGAWLPTHQRPYIEVVSEYPQAATYLFGLPYWLLGLAQPGAPVETTRYAAFFSLLMMPALAATVVVTYGMLPADHKRRAYLLLLPTTIYFAFNRYDILPSLSVLLSLQALGKNQAGRTGFFLGVAVMLKWYAALVLPIYLQYAWSSQRRVEWRMLAAFGLTLAAVCAPTLWAGGLPALLVPFRFHLARGLEPGSLMYGLSAAVQAAVGGSPAATITLAGLALQFVGVPLVLVSRISSLESVRQWSIVTVAAFMVFGRYYSPQWLLWLLPLLILQARSGYDQAYIVVLNAASYLTFPVVYDLFGAGDAFALAGVALAVMLLALIVRVWPAAGVGGWLFAPLAVSALKKET